jgi:hypothetical protein
MLLLFPLDPLVLPTICLPSLSLPYACCYVVVVSFPLSRSMLSLSPHIVLSRIFWSRFELFVPLDYSTISTNTTDFVPPMERNWNMLKNDIHILDIRYNMREDLNIHEIWYSSQGRVSCCDILCL